MTDAPIKLQAALFITQKAKMSILECEAVAKDLEQPNMSFDLVGPKGRFQCRWMDPHYGIFERVGEPGTYHTKQFQYAADIHCENLGVE
jgi:hypothetical protein